MLPQPFALRGGRPLIGRTALPGDKSLSHRALLFSALAEGPARVRGLLESEDIASTAGALAAMGVTIARDDEGWTIHGMGLGGLLPPRQPLDLGNSGTTARLLAGVLAGHDFRAFLWGDASLSARPMARVFEPLRAMGLEAEAAPGDRLPALVRGLAGPLPLVWRLDTPSAQVKSAILLAGLHAMGVTELVEPIATRDHTERLLKAMGARIETEPMADGGRRIRIEGGQPLHALDLAIPGDPSSAAFLLVAASIVPESELVLEGVGMNPGRTGLIDTLVEMGADITVLERFERGGEPVAHLRVRAAPLSGVRVPAERAPSMIDEYPALFVAAALARGRTEAEGLAELRVKESDRLASMARGLAACGVNVDERADGLIVHGSGGRAVPGGARIDPRLDHRIAMSFAVLGLRAERPITLADEAPVATSFPGFVALMERLGAVAERG